MILIALFTFGETTIGIKSPLAVYTEIYETVPFYRFVNSTEGIGQDYIKELLSTTLESTNTNIQNFLNAPMVFYSDKDYSFGELFNPNYFNLLFDLMVNSKSIAIYSTEYDVFNEIFTKIFGANKVSNDLYTLEEKNFAIQKNEVGIFLNMEPTTYDNNSNALVSGSLENVLNENNLWDFYVTVDSRTLKATFESKDYRGAQKNFDLTLLENKKLFGEVLNIQKLDKTNFPSYFENFLTPLDDESKNVIGFIVNSIKEEEFIAVSSQSISNNELNLFFEASIDTYKLREFAEARNMEEGNIGTYNYYLWSNQSVENQVYLYFIEEEFIFSNVLPDKMNVYLSEIQRFKNTKYYEEIERKESLNSLLILDISNYLSVNFYSSLDSWVIKEEYDNNGLYTIEIKIR
ncbi:hypothetical protein HWHPT5561_06950 [Petrotoga sp. HWH.PT.55.6.1]|uniref:hypothetical protein n=1 Tax=unclassified Petrotoga TaxID=2620614 RepID=UPI000CA0401E|nr:MULTISPECIES: hypothetical protein [unclassified Petrotoga]PNR94131.1 hypothetical protein X926_01160 [Petrotoga sp. HWHPT.55.6.3]RPD35552.1 hypothetical protein HWHPT5561_06950 [Petrotoga sp. HWH.PT.55.6.1]